LIILKPEFRPTILAQIDMAISAELHDPKMDPKWMFETVSKCMMHGPCGPAFPNAPCMQDGRCSKGYPRPFQNETSLDENGYPLYRRRNNGLKVLVKGVELDNHWVVPYNPYLCKKFNGHINTEASISIYGVKYMFKYIYKGHDRATVVIERVKNPIDGQQVKRDEIQEYIDARYVSASEVVWRIFKMKLHGRFPAVQRLQVHLPNQQTMVFSEDADLQEVVKKSNCRNPTLAKCGGEVQHLEKLGIWSPPGLPNVQSSIERGKTPRIGVFLVSLERS